MGKATLGASKDLEEEESKDLGEELERLIELEIWGSSVKEVKP